MLVFLPPFRLLRILTVAKGIWDSPADYISSIVLGEFSSESLSRNALNIFAQLTPM
jgi:hypothetical protein